MKMSLLTKVYNGYTIEFLVDAASKLGLATPETDAEFETLAADIKSKREYQVILDVENGFEVEAPERTESERVIHAFMADLVGSRRGLQDKFRNELVRAFCELVFHKLMDDMVKNPFAISLIATISKSEFDNYSQIHSLVVTEGQYKLSKKITETVSDLGIREVKIDMDSRSAMIFIYFA